MVLASGMTANGSSGVVTVSRVIGSDDEIGTTPLIPKRLPHRKKG
jgi:hypothetical protein